MPTTSSTDETLEDRIAEIIREAALHGVRDELPHSIAVTVDDVAAREDSDLTDVYANIVVERDSQKAIIIGKKDHASPMSGRAPRRHRASRRWARLSVAARARREGMAA